MACGVCRSGCVLVLGGCTFRPVCTRVVLPEVGMPAEIVIVPPRLVVDMVLLSLDWRPSQMSWTFISATMRDGISGSPSSRSIECVIPVMHDLYNSRTNPRALRLAFTSRPEAGASEEGDSCLRREGAAYSQGTERSAAPGHFSVLTHRRTGPLHIPGLPCSVRL